MRCGKYCERAARGVDAHDGPVGLASMQLDADKLYRAELAALGAET
jgi:hypothetical protein